MGIRGINSHGWFYRLQALFRSDPTSGVILAGAACEQWFNGQFYRAVADALQGSRVTAYPEWNKRQHDLALFDVTANETVDWDSPRAIVELKLLYRSYSPSDRRKRIRRLIDQVCEPGVASQRYGYLFGVYAYWIDDAKPAESMKAFRLAIRGEFLKELSVAPPRGFTLHPARTSMETLLKEQVVRIGPRRVIIGCVGQYFTAKPI